MPECRAGSDYTKQIKEEGMSKKGVYPGATDQTLKSYKVHKMVYYISDIVKQKYVPRLSSLSGGQHIIKIWKSNG